MKKLLAFLLLCTMLLASLSSLAETAQAKIFDHTVLKQYPGYSYNKADKTWSYYAVYGTAFEDKVAFIGMDLASDQSTGAIYPILYVQAGTANGETLLTADGITFWVDEKVYAYSNLIASGRDSIMILGSIGKQMAQDIVKAKEIYIKINFTNMDLPLKPTLKELSGFIAICENLLKHQVWDYLGDAKAKEYDEQYDATRWE